MSRAEYAKLLHELLSGNPGRVREANKELFSRVVQDGASSDTMDADLVLVESTGLRGGA